MRKPLEYRFAEQLDMSAGVAASADVRDILLGNLKGAVGVAPAARVNDRQGVDWWVELSTARHLAVDAKVRATDWAASHPDQDDLALETFSVVEKGIAGWTRDASKRCDYVLWLWSDTRRFCLVPFPFLCSVFEQRWRQWLEQFKTCRQFTPHGLSGYHSECVFVPRREVWGAIYGKFGGQIRLAGKSSTVDADPRRTPTYQPDLFGPQGAGIGA